MKYVLVLIILFNNGDYTLMQNRHPPFDTKDECEDYGKLMELKTSELLAKMIDEGKEVLDHGMACKPTAE